MGRAMNQSIHQFHKHAMQKNITAEDNKKE